MDSADKKWRVISVVVVIAIAALVWYLVSGDDESAFMYPMER
ncbi:MAG: hypothetical protein AAF957_02660 [Planctomycetota bacterium]